MFLKIEVGIVSIICRIRTILSTLDFILTFVETIRMGNNTWRCFWPLKNDSKNFLKSLLCCC